MEALKKITIGDIEPDLTFFLDIDPLVGINRSKSRKSSEVRYENMDISFHYELREAFKSFSKKNPKKSVMIDANQDLNKISDIIFKEIQQRFKF